MSTNQHGEIGDFAATSTVILTLHVYYAKLSPNESVRIIFRLGGLEVKIRFLRAVCAVLATIAAMPFANAQETVTYEYDALGRLSKSTVSGGPADGTQTVITLDPAGNRSNYTVSGVPVNTTSFAVSGAESPEGDALLFTITRSGTASLAVSVEYASSDGSARSPIDYAPISGVISFLPSETSKTVSVPTTDDDLMEGAETVTLTLSAPSSGATITTGQATGTITDNDSTFAIGNAAATIEGGTLTFTVTRTGATSLSQSVSYASANGTATAGADYTAATGTLNFAPGETAKTIAVATIDDSSVEPAETIVVNLSLPTAGATIASGQATGTITDNDSTFAIGNAAAAAEGGTLTFTVTRTGAPSLSQSVSYASANGTATAGADYTAATGTLTFAPGETTKTIAVATIDDGSAEPAETIVVNLSLPTGGATIATGQATGTITDNDSTFAIGNAGIREGGSLEFRVTRTGATTSSQSVSYASADGTATAPADYAASTGILTFLPGESAKTFEVTTFADSIVEPSETLVVNLSSPTGGATIATGQGIGTIVDNNTALEIGNAGVGEGGTLIFIVTNTGTPSQPQTVNYATADGTATSGVDYTAATGTLTFAVGESRKAIAVATIDDASKEPNETVIVTLSSPTGGATITAGEAIGTINDNELENRPPFARTDITYFQCTTTQVVDVVSNDTDPEGNIPLSLISITPNGTAASYAAVTSSTTVTVGASSAGTYEFTYVVSDSLGATSTGKLTAFVTSGWGVGSKCLQF